MTSMPFITCDCADEIKLNYINYLVLIRIRKVSKQNFICRIKIIKFKTYTEF